MINNWPLLQDLMALDSLKLDYTDIEKFETDDIEAHQEAIAIQQVIEDKRKEVHKYLYWN